MKYIRRATFHLCKYHNDARLLFQGGNSVSGKGKWGQAGI